VDNGSDGIRRTVEDRKHSPSRERVLRDVESHGSATIADLVERTGLHENTLRGHLQRLVADGYLRRTTEASKGRGRPTHRWMPVAANALPPYTGLALSLTEALQFASEEALPIARDAGERWGAKLTAERFEAEDARSVVITVMREQGFAPDDIDEGQDEPGGTMPIVLRRCPLLAASQRSTIVCTVHEGMVEGIARSRDASAQAGLRPFAADGACLLYLSTAS